MNQEHTENAITDNTETAYIPKPEAPIIASIRQEQKYTLMLLSVLHEQLAEFDIGKTPDYSIMLEIMTHASSLPARFNHAVKINFIEKVISSSDDGHIPLENLLAEQIQVREVAKEVINALKGLLKEETILREEQFKIFVKNYIDLLESHIEIENSYLLETDIPLSDDELQLFSDHLQQNDDPTLTTLIEERYKILSKQFNHSLDDLEEAASDFAFSNFINISAFFDTIEPFTAGVYKISDIVKDFSYQMYLDNYRCYKELLTQKQDDPKQYIQRPVDCMLDSYKSYVESLHKIKNVLSKTRKEIREPYETRQKILKKYKA